MTSIIAIDPGTTQSALLVWDGRSVSFPRIVDNHIMLQWLRSTAPHMPLAIEMVACYGMAVGREVFETCLMVGRVQEVWESKMLDCTLVYRKDVKMHLCGSMKAKDPNIRQALIDRFGNVGTKKNPGPLYGVSSHLWSALAIAVTALEAKPLPAPPPPAP
jgi:hypothetical protein